MEFDAGVVSGETPADGVFGFVAVALPSGNPRMEEPLRALLECAMAEHMGEAGADEAEAHVVRHMKALGLAALTGWACQAEQECTRSLMRDEPGARRRTKKK